MQCRATFLLLNILSLGRLLQQKDVFERFDLPFKALEKTVADFEVMFIQKFSDVGPDVNELERQLSDVMVIKLFAHF